MSQHLSLPDLIQQGQLPPHSEEKNVVSQINRYNRWLVESGRRLYQPDLEAYRDHLLGSLKPSSVKVHLSNIRRQFTHCDTQVSWYNSHELRIGLDGSVVSP